MDTLTIIMFDGTWNRMKPAKRIDVTVAKSDWKPWS